MMLSAITTPTIAPGDSELLASVTALESTAMYSNIHALLASVTALESTAMYSNIHASLSM